MTVWVRIREDDDRDMFSRGLTEIEYGQALSDLIAAAAALALSEGRAAEKCVLTPPEVLAIVKANGCAFRLLTTSRASLPGAKLELWTSVGPIELVASPNARLGRLTVGAR